MPAVNTYIKPKPEQEQPEPKPKKGLWGKISSTKIKVSDDVAIKYLPYLLYLTVLGIIYIANAHNAEKLAGEITKTQREVKKLQMEYSTLKYEFMNANNKERVALKLKQMGLQPNDKSVIRIKKK